MWTTDRARYEILSDEGSEPILVFDVESGSVVVIEFSDGMHEYVTTPVKRVLRVAARDVFYIETVNSRYRLEVRDRERALEDASSG